ncbi:MAG: adenosylcobinamide-phosphate synthase CbiB [Pseudomonadota bacterium]
MNALLLIVLAWAIELAIGWPDAVYRRIRHPVVWFGVLVSAAERLFNRSAWSHRLRYLAGLICTLVLVGIVTLIAIAISIALPNTFWGIAIEALLASSLIASRSLRAHILAVAEPLSHGDLERARQAVAMIVGRDPFRLDQAGVARATLESLAENTSDGVIAPLFWGGIFGLPGLAAYKAINTLDSMIGHKSDRYLAFGGFAARLDDLANLIPARLTGWLFAISRFNAVAVQVMLRDAPRHRSPNAGWPEAAMAGSLGVRLSGPRVYGCRVSEEPWLNEGARDPEPSDIMQGLALYRRTLGLAAVILLVCLLWLSQ